MKPAERLRQAATVEDPYTIYDELRGESPLQVSRSSWILLSYDHVRTALSDPDTFSSNVRESDNPVFRNSPLIFDDPPRHTQLRRLVTKAFTPRRVADAEPWVRELAAELLDAIGDAPVDFVEAFADPLPVRVVSRMLGVPDARHREFKQWSNDRSYVVYHSRGARTPELEAAEAGCVAQEEFLLTLAKERRANPGDDLLSALATAEIDGERLAIEEVAGTCSVLLSAGNITTTRLIENMAATLAGDPARYAALRADRSLLAEVVEESLRVDSPVQTPIRKTTRDVELGGKVIPAGSFVTIGIGAANRDDAGFDQPHVAFGFGIHYCLGAALARLEATVSFDVIADRYAAISAAEPPKREIGMAHRGFERVVLRLSEF
jgi:cytochrome P450